MTTAATELGFVGLGKMGGAMSLRLIDSGYKLTVYDVDSKALDRVVSAGGIAAASPEEVASKVPIVFTCLPSPGIVEEVLLGERGLCHGRKVELVAECSTSSPELAQKFATGLKDGGITMLDSPISGGVKRAREGELAVIASGPRAAFDRMVPVYRALGKPFHLGERPGMAQMAKLINNLLSNVATAATYEAFVLGAKAGLDVDALLEVVNAGTGVNNCTQNKMPRSVLPRTFDYGSNMEITYKDITQCMKEAEKLGVTMLLGNMACQLWSHGYHQGGAKKDSSTLIKHFEQWAGVEVVGRAAASGGEQAS